MFWLRKKEKIKKPFDSKAIAKEVKFYIQSKIPGVKAAKEDISEQKQQNESKFNDLSGARFALDDSKIRYSISRTDDTEQEVKPSPKPINIEDDYKAWEKGHSSRKTFSALILNKIKETGISSREFYSRAGIDRKLFSKIKTDFCYQPTKITAIRCCFALDLSADEADSLLKIAGYALSETIPFDLAIRYCISHGITDIDNVNLVLYELEERTL